MRRLTVLMPFHTPFYAPLPAGISLNAPGNEIPSGHIFPGFFAETGGDMTRELTNRAIGNASRKITRHDPRR